MSKNVQALLNSAADDGNLSMNSVQALTTVNDIGAQIQAGLGVDVDSIESSEVVLLSIMPDDSSSIGWIKEDPQDYNSVVVGPKLMCEGSNAVIEALQNSKQAENILALNRYLNGKVLYPYAPLNQTEEMVNNQNYYAGGGTPLYDQAVVLLGTVLAKTQEFSDNGVPVRTVTLIISDGDDTASRNSTPSDVKKIVEDMMRSENHIVAAMGIDDGNTDFKQVFNDMGIRDEWILTPKNTASDIRKAFQVFSQSAIRASQGGGSFSQTAMAGFGS